MNLLTRCKQLFVVASFALLLGCQSKDEFTVKDVPDPKRSGNGYVSNPDGILVDSTVVNINATLSSLDQSGRAQVAVVVLKSIGDKVPKDFAVELFNYWGIGIKGVDNGLLILVVEDQHRIEFETGYGLEADLTDVLCYRIQQDYMIPYAKMGDLNFAVFNGVNAVIAQLNGVPLQGSQQDDNNVVEDQSSQNTEEEITQEEEPLSIDLANILNVLGYNFFPLLFSAIVSLIIIGGDLPKLSKPTKNQLVTRDFLFNNSFYHNVTFTSLFITLGPLLILEILFIIYRITEFPFYIALAAVYVSWCLFVHLYYLVILPIRSSSISSIADRHIRHEQWSQAYRYLNRFSYFFPFPFLLLWNMRNKMRLAKLRNTPYTCECGHAMRKLDEIQDDNFLQKPQTKEEAVKSIDYDVWICDSCQKQKILSYENYTSSIHKCEKCAAKTLKKTGSEVVQEATYTSGGYGYRIFDCQHCNHQVKVKYTIPKKTESSSSGGSSSGGGSWGGGSSGGGGAGSSW
jgi:uncharacterized protein